MGVYIISLGSNYHAYENMCSARKWLTEAFPSIVYGQQLDTEPVGLSNPAHFLNQVARFETTLEPEAVSKMLKQFEILAGRTPESKLKEEIPLDIDILVHNHTILRPAEMEKKYIKQGMQTLTDRTTPPAIAVLDKIEIPRPSKTIMSNGVPLYIVNAGSQDVVRIDVVFKGGSWNQTHKLQALFANRMLREGTTKYTAAVISEKLDYYGAWLELSSSLEYTYVTLYSLNKYLCYTIDILESMIKEPVFPQEELATVIETNVQQFRINASKVDFIAHRSLLSSLFGNQYPCGQLTQEEDYAKITPGILYEFHAQYYNSNNCTVYLSGKVTDEVQHLIEAHFGNTAFGKKESSILSTAYKIDSIPSKRIYTECPDALQTAVRLGCLTISRHHPDYHKLRVLVTLFGGYFGSRLMSNVREDKGYTYSISAGMFFYPDTGLLVVSTETGNEFVEPIISEIYKEIDRLQQQDVDPEELSLVRNHMLGEMARSYESPFSIADAWIFVHTSGLDENYFEQMIEAVKTTTPKDLRQLACRYLNKETLKEIVAGLNLS